MYTVYSDPPDKLAQIKTEWPYAKDYFPRTVDSIPEARSIAKLAIAQGGQHVQIIKAHANPDSEPEFIPLADPVGVTIEFNLPYVCGLALARYGLDAGIPEEVVLWTQEGSGYQNLQEVRRALVAAWHVLRGYLGRLPSAVPPTALLTWGCRTEDEWWAGAEENVKARLQQIGGQDALF